RKLHLMMMWTTLRRSSRGGRSWLASWLETQWANMHPAVVHSTIHGSLGEQNSHKMPLALLYEASAKRSSTVPGLPSTSGRIASLIDRAPSRLMEISRTFRDTLTQNTVGLGGSG